MTPKGKGGIGNKSAQEYVAELRLRLGTEQEVRAQLKKDGYKAGRISQLLKATRPAEGQAGPAAAAALPKRMARPAAAEPAVAARKKPASAAPALAPEATGQLIRQTILAEAVCVQSLFVFLLFVPLPCQVEPVANDAAGEEEVSSDEDLPAEAVAAGFFGEVAAARMLTVSDPPKEGRCICICRRA